MRAMERTVVYVIGPTASGKTTASQALGHALDMPVVCADHVYGTLKERFGVVVAAEEILDFEKWDDPANFGIVSWGSHASIHEAKVDGYAELLEDVRHSSVILEGFSLSWALERLIVRSMLLPTRSVVVRLDLDTERWIEQYVQRYGTTFGRDASEMALAHEFLKGQFERQDGEVVFSCTTPEEASGPAMVDVLSALI